MKRKGKVPSIQIWEGVQIQAKITHKPEPLQELDRDIVTINHSQGIDVINKAQLVCIRFVEKDRSCTIRLTGGLEFQYAYDLGTTLARKLRFG